MRETSGIIINDDIFINSSNVVKIDKSKREEYRIEVYTTNKDTPISLSFETESDRDVIYNDIFTNINTSNIVKVDTAKIKEYTIEIYMTNSESPIVISFDNENELNVIFNKIVMKLYGNNYAHVNF